MRPLLPSVAMVTAVFLLGCQELASGPVGPEGLVPQFDKPISGVHGDHGNGGDDDAALIEAGRNLFFNEMFGGNGRTCGTCHRELNNLTIDVDFIATLPDNDPLFVAEFNNDLRGLESGGVDGLLRTRGLILENIQGFDLDPVFRAPPSLFNLSFTAPYGYSGNVPNLREFTTGAVIQHFPKTLARESGGENPDFVLPTEAQLDAIEAFLLSLESPEDGNFKLPRGNKRRPEVRGRAAFRSVGCGSCHGGTVLSGGNRATGVEDLPNPDGLPRDIGAGDVTNPSFQTPGLFGLRKAAFFHNNAVVGLRNAVAFYATTAFTGSPTGGQVGPMTDAEIDDITAFLVAISNE